MSLGKVMMKHSSPQSMTNFQDLITKEKNLVTLAPVLGTILRPANGWKKKTISDSTEVFYKINLIKH